MARNALREPRKVPRVPDCPAQYVVARNETPRPTPSRNPPVAGTWKVNSFMQDESEIEYQVRFEDVDAIILMEADEMRLLL